MIGIGLSLKWGINLLALIYLSILIVVRAKGAVVTAVTARIHLCGITLYILWWQCAGRLKVIILIRVIGSIRRVLICVGSSEILRWKNPIDRFLSLVSIVLIFLMLFANDERRMRRKYQRLVPSRWEFSEHFICIIACLFYEINIQAHFVVGSGIIGCVVIIGGIFYILFWHRPI